MLTAEQIEELESLAYMWDSNGGWIIDECETPMYSLAVQFSGSGGPNIVELARMRRLLPELAELSPAEAKARIGTANICVLGNFTRQSGLSLRRLGQKLGLNILGEMRVEVFCQPIHTSGMAPPIIDDDEELEYVIQKMREAGRPLRITSED